MFEDFDPEDFWEVQDTHSGPPTLDPFTDEDLRDAEKDFGLRLPASYVALMRTQNGGVLRRTHFPATGTSWSDDHVEINMLFGIGWGMGGLLSGDGMEALKKQGVPELGIIVGQSFSKHGGSIMLDYRECGPLGEPAVTYVERDEDASDADDDAPTSDHHERLRFVTIAPDFETFVRKLVDEDTFDASEEDMEFGQFEIAARPLSPHLQELLQVSAEPEETEAALRRLLQDIATEKGFLTLSDDPKSHLVYDILFTFYAASCVVKRPGEFVYTLIQLLVSGDGDLSIGAYAPHHVVNWLNAREKDGALVDDRGRYRLSEAHQLSVFEAFDAYLPPPTEWQH